GGQCLSTVYIDSHTPLNWKCAKGHQWSATRSSIYNNKSWCRKCLTGKSRGSIQIMQQIAEKRGGRCLSTEYINCNTKLDWECVKGHRWSTTPEIISQGSWCQVCY